MLTQFQLLILTLTFAIPAFAQWAPGVRPLMESTTAKAVHLSNPAVATFWGGFRRFRFFTHNDGGIEQFKSPLFKTGEFPIYFSQKSFRAQLFVFMPGIYGQPGKGLTAQFVDFLEKIPGHVLVVPNLLGPDYVEAHPLYKTDPVAREVQVMEEALDYALRKIGDRVSRIEVIAESLGTAVGSAWAAHDSTHQKRINGLTLLWPPLNLPVAMKNFDAIINEYRPAAEKCSTPFKLYVLAREFALKDYPAQLDKEEEECMAALVLVDGFVDATKVSWRSHVKATQATGPEPEGFEEYFRRYRGELWELLEKKDQRLTLTHWMKQIRQSGHLKVRIMTSENDFLNRGLDWELFKTEHRLSTDELIILPWGGHSGAVSVAEFYRVLEMTFSEVN